MNGGRQGEHCHEGRRDRDLAEQAAFAKDLIDQPAQAERLLFVVIIVAALDEDHLTRPQIVEMRLIEGDLGFQAAVRILDQDDLAGLRIGHHGQQHGGAAVLEADDRRQDVAESRQVAPFRADAAGFEPSIAGDRHQRRARHVALDRHIG